ncbi:hypothetical protein [Amycolatopsis keratiniphila]|uniref:Uncharacterized protein n=1 Tax=Amycolatopsis keratiniphila TaxID=129921 RepID=R4T3R3_9PSEU|nr:hypothetical protein [Amycolatopsis keratiniphila]AGM07056.1 hypothetical protein AORI_4471 [Amycolatopsis keratiniphila]
MSGIEMIVATLETAMAAIDHAERAGTHAASGFEESSRLLGQAVSGTSDAQVADNGQPVGEVAQLDVALLRNGLAILE